MNKICTFTMDGVRLNLVNIGNLYYSVVYNRIRVFSSDDINQCKKVFDMVVRNLIFSPFISLDDVLVSCNESLVLNFHRNKNFKFVKNDKVFEKRRQNYKK